jgi:hypothetical protein
MSTPAISTPAAAPVVTPLSWLQKHERIVIAAMVIALGAWLVQRHYNVAAQDATTRATIAEAKAATADSTAAQSAATLQQAIAAVQANNATLVAQNQALAQLVASRQTAVVVQQHTDSTLSQSALSTKIAALASAPPAEVTFDDTNIRLGRNAAVDVVQTLELVQPLQASLADETTIAKNTQTELDGANKIIADQGTDIVNLSTARTADAAACQAELKQEKADAKKNNIKWFRRGVYVGFVGGFIVGEKVGKFLGL